MVDRMFEGELLKRHLMAIAGVAAPTGAYVVARRYKTQSGQEATDSIGESIGPKRLVAEPQEVIAEFVAAKPGNLAVYCQLFWPAYRTGAMRGQLELQCRRALAAAPADADQYKIRLLPILARIHALGWCRPTEGSEHEAIVLSAAISARQGSSSSPGPFGIAKDRDILEFIWRGMHCALTRNANTWALFTIDEPVLHEAESVVQQYAAGEDILFGPAIAAWQFILTYLRASRVRPGHQTTAIHRMIERVTSNHVNDRLGWFQRMYSIYNELNSFDEMPPQFNEIWMGYKLPLFDDRAKEFAALVAFGKIYVNSLALAGGSPYVPKDRAREYRIWPNVSARFGISRIEWRQLKNSTYSSLLSNEARQYIDDGFDSYKETELNSSNEVLEQIRATTLSLWVPFRKRDAEVIFDRVYGQIELNGLIDLFGNITEDKLAAIWRKSIIFEGGACGEQCNLSTLPNDIVNRAFREIPSKRLTEHIPIIRDIVERAQSIAKTTVVILGLSGVPEGVAGSEGSPTEAGAHYAAEAVERTHSNKASATNIPDRDVSGLEMSRAVTGGSGEAHRNDLPSVSHAGSAIEGAPSSGSAAPFAKADAFYAVEEVEDVHGKRASTNISAEAGIMQVVNEPEDTVIIPDFNLLPLNGDDPKDILVKFGVHVKVLGYRDRRIGAHPVWIAGDVKSVASYVQHLQSTWPSEPIL
jgi:hypothetical protein